MGTIQKPPPAKVIKWKRGEHVQTGEVLWADETNRVFVRNFSTLKRVWINASRIIK